MIVSLHIGKFTLDLYSSDNIEVNSSVANIKDITKNQTDFTKTFTVPASDNNNKLFKHYYDADIDDGFDARIKVDGEIKLDGFLFRSGKFRLYKVAIKKGVPSSYTISFFGKLLTISSLVGNDFLSDLDLSEFNHTNNDSTVKTGLQSSLFSGDLIYNLLVKKQYYYNSNAGDTETTEKSTNIGYGDGSGLNGIEPIDLNPSLRVIKIIEAIENDYEMTFSRDFFGLTEFTDIFTWLSSSRSSVSDGVSQTVDWTSTNSTFINLTTNKGTYPSDKTYIHKNIITPDAGFEDIEYTFQKINNNGSGDVVQHTKTDKGTRSISDTDPAGGSDNVVHYTVSSSREFKYTAILTTSVYVGATLENVFTTNATTNTVLSDVSISEVMPKIKIIDFLKGLFNMFKLVVIPQDDGTTYVDTFNNYYLKGGLIDVTRHVDFSSYDVERGEILNEINFKFKEPTTLLNTQFDINTGMPYGDEEAVLKDLNGEVLDGTKSEFKLPFETVIFERLTDLFTDTQSNVQYGSIIDESLEAVNPKMTLFYNINQPLETNQLGYINDVGLKTLLSGNINTPSHTDVFLNPNFSMLFGAEFSTWNGNLISNTLYRNYHEDYILSIFDIKKRSYKYKAVLPLNIMLDLELNDTLQIKDTFYRIDNFTTNLVNGKVTLNLINSLSTAIGGTQIAPLNFTITSASQVVSSSIVNADDLVITLQDIGFGTSWATTNIIGSNLFYDLDENTTGLLRGIDILLTSSASGYSETATILQSAERLTLDNNIATLDNNTITLDNN